MQVLSGADLEFWREHGYVVVRDAVPAQNLRAAIDAIWEFLEMDREDPSTWYRGPLRANEMLELNGAGMVELYHHAALWANREHPRIHRAFADLWDDERLWVSVDRVNFSPPSLPGSAFSGFIHWDIDTSLRPIPFEVQGVLSLVDTSEAMGGFQCVDGFPRRFEAWVRTQPADRDPGAPTARPSRSARCRWARATC